MANASSDYNLQKINTKEFSEHVKGTIEFGGNLFVVGARGSGKTTIIKEIIKETGLKEVYLNLSMIERTDFQGFPNFFEAQTKKINYINYILPRFFEALIEGDKPVVAILDEVDKCETSLLAPLLEFTQFRSINGRELPNLRAVIMTGNFASESGSKPPAPLLDRAETYMLEASHTHWLDWAGKTGRIHPSISSFISDNPDELFGDVDIGEMYSDPSPRGWENASKILNFGEEKKWSNKLLVAKVAGCIGKKTGIKYSSYFDHYQVLLPIVEKIMKGDEIKGFNNLEQSKQMVTTMITCSRLSRILDNRKPNNKELPMEANTVAKFLKNVDPEMALISVRSQIGLDRIINSGVEELPAWDEILRNIAKRINV